MIDMILDNLDTLLIFGFIGSISGLMILGIAGSMLAACWKAARRALRMAWKVWKWLAGQLKTEPQAQVVCKQQAKPQPKAKPRDTKPLGQIPPNWQRDFSVKLGNKTLPPTTPSPMPQTLPPIMYH